MMNSVERARIPQCIHVVPENQYLHHGLRVVERSFFYELPLENSWPDKYVLHVSGWVKDAVNDETEQDCDWGLPKWPLTQMVAAHGLDAAPEK